MLGENPFVDGRFQPSAEQLAKLEVFDRRLQNIARQISGDSSLRVEAGEPGRGEWYFDPENNIVKWDPAEVLRKAEHAEEEILGKIAHEGGHRAITRWREVFDMEEMQNVVGLQALIAAVEERPTDMVVKARYKGAGDWLRSARRGSIEEGNQSLQGKDLGYIPEYSQLCSYIVYEPYYQSKPETVSAEIVEKYQELRDSVEKIENLLPPAGSAERRVVDDAKSRHRMLMKELWPKVQELVEKDLEKEKERQALGEELRKALNGESTSIPEDILRNIIEQIIKELKRQIEAAMTEDDRGLEEAIKRMQEAGDETPNVTSDELSLDQLKKNLKIKLAGRGGNIPIPMDKLTPEEREIAKKSYQSKDSEAKRIIDKKAKENLAGVEGALVKSILGDLGEGLPLHGEKPVIDPDDEDDNNESEEHIDLNLSGEQDVKNEGQEEERILRKLREEAERKLKELEDDKSEYDKVYEQVREYDEELYSALEEHFHPTRETKAKLKMVGSRLNLPAVYKWEAARKGGGKNIPAKIFETLSTPEELDHSVTILVDLSGSMQGEKITETFKGVVLLTEVLNRLGVKLEILGFQDELIHFKDFDDDLNKAVRNRMSGMLLEVYNENPGGHNYAGCNDDGPCLREASDRLTQNASKKNIIMVLSDGLPAGLRSTSRDLVDVVNHIITGTDQILIGVGLGSGTGHVEKFYPISAPNLKIDQIAESLGGLLEMVMTHPEMLIVKNEEMKKRKLGR